jgi:hypothetical protein
MGISDTGYVIPVIYEVKGLKGWIKDAREYKNPNKKVSISMKGISK